MLGKTSPTQNSKCVMNVTRLSQQYRSRLVHFTAFRHIPSAPGSRTTLPRPPRPPVAVLVPIIHSAYSIHSTVTPSMDALVDQLQHEGRLKAPHLADAMRAVDRAHFVAQGTPADIAYTDAPLPLGLGETISAPHMHAACLDLLHRQLQPGAHVLDVGSGILLADQFIYVVYTTQSQNRVGISHRRPGLTRGPHWTRGRCGKTPRAGQAKPNQPPSRCAAAAPRWHH